MPRTGFLKPLLGPCPRFRHPEQTSVTGLRDETI
jgi:hypothetical protein